MSEKPTEAQITLARQEGALAFAKRMGTNSAGGKHRCTYTDADLRRAWLEGYDRAARMSSRP